MAAILPPDHDLTDGVVRLRVWRDDDVEAITRACQDPEIARWTRVPSPYTADDARRFVAHARRLAADGVAAPLAIAHAHDDGVLGASGLNALDAERASADVGYWVEASARRRGVATRALRLVTAWAFHTLGMTLVELRPHRDNAASQAVARAAGFVEVDEAVTRGTVAHEPGLLVFARRSDGT